MYRNIILVAFATLLFSSKLCAQDMGVEFVLPSIPNTLVTPEDRANYLALHYWDELDMSTIQRNECEIVSQAFADFVTILPHATNRSEAFATLWHRSYHYPDAFYEMLHLAELYLYDVASPLRNEEFYIEALEAINSDPNISDIDKFASTAQLEMLKRNRIGELATDFEFVDKQDTMHRLSDYDAEYMLLLFASADCEECKRMKRDLNANTRLWMMLRRGTLAIVVITISEDKSLWLETTHPDNWIEGWDSKQTLERESIYDLTTLPRLYLLDRDKRVILKNTTPKQIEEYLN